MIVIEPNLLLQSISYTHKIVSGTADIKGREGVTQQQYNEAEWMEWNIARTTWV